MKPFITISLILASYLSLACDVCGGNMGGIYFGIMPQYQWSNVGMRYQVFNYHSSIIYNSQYLDDQYSNDRFDRIEWNARVMVTDRLQMRATIPYQFNSMHHHGENIETSGVSDPTILVTYQWLNTADSTVRFKQSLMMGGGIKLPLGTFDQMLNGDLLNANFQLGSGSYDFPLVFQYIVRRRNMGINLEGQYKFNTSNKNQYRFGNQTTVNASHFYWIETKPVAIIPFYGFQFENFSKHHENDAVVLNTGGSMVLFSTGLQLHRNNWSVNMGLSLPISQYYHLDQYSTIDAKTRKSIGITWNIRKKTKISK